MSVLSWPSECQRSYGLLSRSSNCAARCPVDLLAGHDDLSQASCCRPFLDCDQNAQSRTLVCSRAFWQASQNSVVTVLLISCRPRSSICKMHSCIEVAVQGKLPGPVRMRYKLFFRPSFPDSHTISKCYVGSLGLKDIEASQGNWLRPCCIILKNQLQKRTLGVGFHCERPKSSLSFHLAQAFHAPFRPVAVNRQQPGHSSDPRKQQGQCRSSIHSSSLGSRTSEDETSGRVPQGLDRQSARRNASIVDTALRCGACPGLQRGVQGAHGHGDDLGLVFRVDHHDLHLGARARPAQREIHREMSS